MYVRLGILSLLMADEEYEKREQDDRHNKKKNKGKG